MKEHSVSRSGSGALDEDQRRDIACYISKDGKPVPRACLEKLIRDIEASIAAFQAQEPEGPFRQAHDALRTLWKMAHRADADVPAELLRSHIQVLPNRALQYLARRAELINHLDRLRANLREPAPPHDSEVVQFLQWSRAASPAELIATMRTLSAEGQRMVKGRSRGDDKRSAAHWEPEIMGLSRGEPVDTEASVLGPAIPATVKSEPGGRPLKGAEYELVKHLAADWLHARGEKPKAGRNIDTTDFGNIVRLIFEALGLDQESAIYALRRYWADAKREQKRPSLNDFLTRHGEEPIDWLKEP